MTIEREQAMKQYHINDTVWLARFEYEQVIKPCPVCFKTRQVTLILGNGDKVILPCAYCDDGYSSPSGLVTGYKYVAKARQIRITQVDSEETEHGIEYRYHGSPNDYHDDGSLLFDTEEEARIKSVEIKEKYEKEQLTRIENIKKDKHKSFSWNAGYHIGEAKRNRESAEYHDKMAVICKERAPESPSA